MKLEQFDYKYMPDLVERVYNLWTPPQAEESFKRIYAEAVIRQDMHANNMQFQLTEDGRIMAVACASRKGEQNSAGKWWNEQFAKLSDSQKIGFNMSREYITLMDKKTFEFMTKDDVKLDMFISTEKGWGKKVLDGAIASFKQAGFKNLFLWTDTDCNVDWYIAHNYELVDEDIYEPFSSEEDYKTFIFKMKLQ